MITKNNEQKLIALIALAMLTTSCGGGGGHGAASGPKDDTIKLQVPADRNLVKEEQSPADQDKSAGSLLDISPDKVGLEVKGTSSSTVGSDVASKLSQINSSAQANLDQANSDMDALLTELMNNDIARARAAMLKATATAAAKSDAEKEQVRLAREEIEKIAAKKRADALAEAEKNRSGALSTTEKGRSDALSETARQHAAVLAKAESDRLKLLNGIIKAHGGPDAVNVTETLVKVSDDAVQYHIQRVNALVTEIQNWDNRIAQVNAPLTNRDSEVAQINTDIQKIQNKIKGIEDGNLMTVEGIKKAKQFEMDSLDLQMKALQTQIGLLKGEFESNIRKQRATPEYQALYTSYYTQLDNKDGAGILNWTGDSAATLTIKANAKVRADIIASYFFKDNFAIETLQKKFDALDAQKKEAAKTKNNVKPSNVNVAVSNDLATLRKELADKQAEKNSYSGGESTGHFWSGYGWNAWNLYSFEGKMLKQDDLAKLTREAMDQRQKAYTELRSMDSSTVDGMSKTLVQVARIRADRSAESYRDAILTAFDSYRKENAAIIAEKSKANGTIDASRAELDAAAKLKKEQIEAAARTSKEKIETLAKLTKEQVEASHKAEALAAQKSFEASVAKISGILDSEKKAADEEFAKAQTFFRNLKDKLASNLKVVTACQNAEMSSDASKRVLVEDISASIENNTLLSMGTFDDFTKEVTPVKKSHRPDVTYTGTKDFKRFVSVFMTEDGKVVAFETKSGIEPYVIKVEAFGPVADPAADDEGQDASVKLKRGPTEMDMTRYRGSFSSPLDIMSNGTYKVVTCAELNNGAVEARSRKVTIKDEVVKKGKKGIITHKASDTE